MATTKIWPIREGSNLKTVIDYVENIKKTIYAKEKGERNYTKTEYQNMLDVTEYVMQDYKTEEKRLVSGIRVNPNTARDEMQLTKRTWGKEKGILLWHGYQSFAPGEVTPEEAHEIGVKLAENLWGNDYEVLVCTHIDKAHFHNHFVINSVSFRNGKKLDAKWQDMRRESDRLCQQYKKSVIENPTYKGQPYRLYQDTKDGKHTWISIIQQDVDSIIQQSYSVEDFLKKLSEHGYEYRTDRKYFTIRPFGKERHVKLDRWLGETYSLMGIAERISDNVEAGTVQFMKEPRIRHCRNTVKKPYHKKSGYQAIYIYYCYKLGVFQKKPSNVHYLMKEEIRNLDRISAETRLLLKHDIHNKAELDHYEFHIQTEKTSLETYRKQIRNKLKTTDTKELQDKLQELNQKIKNLRTTLDYCEDIKNRSGELKQKADIVRGYRRTNTDRERRDK